MDLDEFRRKAREGISPETVDVGCDTCGKPRVSVYSKARKEKVWFRFCNAHVSDRGRDAAARIEAEKEDVCWRCHGDPNTYRTTDDDGFCISCIGYAVGMDIEAKLPSGNGYVKGVIREIKTIDPDGPCAFLEVARHMDTTASGDELGLWNPIVPGAWSLWVSLRLETTRQPTYGPDRFGGECEEPGCTDDVMTIRDDGGRWCHEHQENLRCSEDGCTAKATLSVFAIDGQTRCDDHHVPIVQCTVCRGTGKTTRGKSALTGKHVERKCKWCKGTGSCDGP